MKKGSGKRNFLLAAILVTTAISAVPQQASAVHSSPTLSAIYQETKAYLNDSSRQSSNPYALYAEQGDNTYSIMINGTRYYYTPSSSDESVITKLVLTGGSAIYERDTAGDPEQFRSSDPVFYFTSGEDTVYYSYQDLPESMYEITEGSASDYNYTTTDGTETSYWKVSIPLPDDGEIGDGVILTTDSSQIPATADTSGQLTLNLPNGKSVDYYYSYETPSGYTTKSRNEYDYDSESSKYYVNDAVYKNIGINAEGGAAISDNGRSFSEISADFVNNVADTTSTNPVYSMGGAINLQSSKVDEISGNFIDNGIKTADSEARGGAVNLWLSNAQLGVLDGNFINNYIEKTSSNGVSRGGAVSIGEAASVNGIEAVFMGNHISGEGSGFGGALSNISGNINSVDSVFIGNYIENGISTDGGAVYNTGNINTIASDFIGNSVNGQYGYGGAVYNESSAVIGSVAGDFIGNSAVASYQALGGALYNYEGNIGDVYSNFTANRAASTDGVAYGGAIYNYATGDFAYIGDITGDFVGNSAEGYNGQGGAIYNGGTTNGESYGLIGNIQGDFIQNKAAGFSAQGGAIFNENAWIDDITGQFIANEAKSGSAIYNNGSYAHIGNLNGYFINNASTSEPGPTGGAIYNQDGRIGSIQGDFRNNTITGEYGTSYLGAAIGNYSGAIGDICGTYEGNRIDISINDSDITVGGGAIANYGTNAQLGNFTDSVFYGNYVKETNTAMSSTDGVKGGAIFNSATDSGNPLYTTLGSIQDANYYDDDDNEITYTYVDGGIMGASFQGNYAQSDNRNAYGGAIYNNGVTAYVDAMFDGNYAESTNQSGYGGAIYNKGIIGLTDEDGVVYEGGISSLFSNNSAATAGGAIYNEGVIANITGTFDSNKTTSSTQETYGGAIYNVGTIGIDNGYGYVTSGGITDSTFTNNEAGTAGGAIYYASDTPALLISAQSNDVEFSGNKAANGAAIYNLSTNGTEISAAGGNVTFTGNNATDEDGYGIYSLATVNLYAKDGYKVTIDDSIDIVRQYADLTVNQGFDYTGDVELNGKINFENSNSGIRVGMAGGDAGTLKLGQTPANETYQYLANAGNYTLDLQNEHAGDNMILDLLSGTGEMKLNVDYDATQNLMDKITVKSGSGSVTLNAVNVMNDNASFVDDTTTEYLDGDARANVSVISSAITTTISGNTVYTFTPTSTHGELSVIREENAYGGDLINAIQDTETVHPDSYSMKADFTADRAFGNLNTDNRESFTIFGNSHTINAAGNNTGIKVANGQELTIKNVNMQNFADSAVENAGTLNMEGVYTRLNPTDIVNTGTLNLSGSNRFYRINGDDGTVNITGGTTTLLGDSVGVTQESINLKGGRLATDMETVINADIIADENYASTYNSVTENAYGGALYLEYTTPNSIQGTFKGNSANTSGGNAYGGAIASIGGLTLDGVAFEANSANGASIYSSQGGAIYFGGESAVDTLSDVSFVLNTADEGGAIYKRLGTLNISGATFDNNTAKKHGAAIYMRGGELNLTDSDIINNTVSTNDSTQRGALYLADIGLWNAEKGDFSEAITANYIADSVNVNIAGNTGWGIVANNNYDSDSALTLYAKGADINVYGNTKGGIYNNGMALTLNADKVGDSVYKVIVNDAITSTNGMTINAEGAHAGTVSLNGALTLGDALSVQGGTLNLGSTAAATEFDTITFANTPTLSLQNENIDSVVINTITGDMNLALDVNFGSTVSVDNFTIASTGSSSNVVITDFEPLNDSEPSSDFTIDLITKGANGDISGINVTIDEELLADITKNNGDPYYYNKIVDDTNEITFDKTTFDVENWKNVSVQTLDVNKTDSAIQLVYGLQSQDTMIGTSTTDALLHLINKEGDRTITAVGAAATSYTVNEHLNENPITQGTLSITGVSGGSTFDMNEKRGFNLGEDVTLNLTNLDFTNLNGEAKGFISNENSGSTVNFKNVNVKDTVTANTILNDLIMNFEGDNEINTGINGAGTLNVNSGKTILTNVIQGTVNVIGGELQVESLKTDFDTVSNAGTLTLTGSSNINNIYGTGSTVIAADLTNSGAIQQAITVNSGVTLTSAPDLLESDVTNSGTVELLQGELTSKIDGGSIIVKEGNTLTASMDNLGGDTITNNGSLYLSGSLNQTIFGTDGRTNISDSLTLGSNASFEGTLNMNNGTLNLSGDDTIAQYTFNNMFVGSGNISLDVNFTDMLADNIVVNYATASDEASAFGGLDLTISDLNIMSGDMPEYFYNVLLAKDKLEDETSNFNLQLNSDLTNQYSTYNNTKVIGKTISDYSDNIDFSKATFSVDEVTEVWDDILTTAVNHGPVDEDGNEISRDNDYQYTYLQRIKFNHADIVSSEDKDALYILNETAGSRSLTTSDNTAVYTLGEDLNAAAMAEGSILVQGSATGTGESRIASTLDMNNKFGFVLSDADRTLTLKDLNIVNVSDHDGGLIDISNSDSKAVIDNVNLDFNGGGRIISSNGSVDITDSEINADILNSGVLTLYGTSTIGSVTDSNDQMAAAGLMNVQGDTTVNGSINQNIIYVLGGKLTATDDVKAKGSILNNVDGGLELQGGTLTGTVTGSGSTTIAGNVILDGSSAVNQAINVASGILTARASQFGGTISNEGTILLQGTLGKAITGDGSVQIDKALDLANGASIIGTLDLNGGQLNLSELANNETAEYVTYEIGNIINGGNLIIDFDGTNSDSINLTSNTDSDAVLTITGLNGLSKDSGSLSAVTILSNASNITLAVSDELKSAFNETVYEQGGYETDEITSSANWSDTFKQRYYDMETGKQLVVDNSTSTKTLAYEVSEQKHYDSSQDISLGDTLALINQKSDTTRSFTTDDAQASYTVSSDLGTTSAGSMTVKGAAESSTAISTSTLNMNGNTGFVVGDGAELTLDTINITGMKSSDGSLINNTAGEVTIKDVIAASNDSNVISNASTLNLEGENTIDAGITGTGTTNVKNGSSKVSAFTQKLLNILSDGKLTASDSVTVTDGISNAVDGGLELQGGTLTANVTGAGSTVINGTVDIASGSTISQGITISDGSLTSSADSILGAVSNAVENGLVLTSGELTTSVTGAGSTVINTTDTVTIGSSGSVAQTIAVQAGTLKTSVSGFTSDITSNAGNVELTGTGDLTKTIAGNTSISGNITNNGSLANVTIADGGTLTTATDNISGTVENSGTLNLSGTLSKAVSGAGTTNVDSELVLEQGAQIAGILDLNNGVLNLNNDSADSYSIGTLNGSGSIKIDLVNNNGTIVSDAITASNYGDGTITITELNNLAGSDLSTFTAAVLNGYTGSNLKLAESIISEYGSTKYADNSITTDLTASADWTDKFGEETWQDIITQSISTDKGNIVYSNEKTGETAHSYAYGDTLAMLNKASQFGTEERKFTTSDASASYDVTSDLGTTAAGTYTIQGTSSGENISTINMNSQNGFNVSSDAVLNIDTVKITGAKTEDGSLINNTAGTVNLNNVTVDTNSSDVIANNSTLNVTDSTINSGISGTGTTTVKGDSLISRIAQKAVEILTGAKLETETVSAADGIANAGELTVTGDVTNTSDITGAGTLNVAGNIVNNAEIENSVVINSGKSLTSSADNIKNTVDNSGTYTVTDGTIANNISGAGTTVIDGSVINSAIIENSVTINSGSDSALTSNADNITGTIANSGTYNVTGGTIANAITGSGDTNINGDTTLKSVISGNVNVAENTTLNVDASTTIANAAKVALANGSTLDIAGNTSSGDTLNNISIAAGDTANLAMDWGDSISTDNILGSLNVSSIDLTATVAGTTDTSYNFATGSNLANAIINSNVNLNTTDTSFNSVKYNSTTGVLRGAKNNLAKAVDENTSGENAIYSMSTDVSEAAGTGEAGQLDAGKLIVQGNGSTIKDYGVIVGNTDDATSAELTIKDANMENITGNAIEITQKSNVTIIADENDISISGVSGDAIIVGAGSSVTISAENANIEISGVSGNAVTLKSDSANDEYSQANINAGSNEITIDNDIISDNANNTVTFNSGTVNFNGLFDPAKAIVDGATVIRGGQDADIQWTVTNGTLRYLDDSYLNNSSNPNSVTLNGGTLDTVNGVVTDFNLAAFNVTADSNVQLDVDLANQKMDNFDSSSSINVSGALHVSGLNLISDASNDTTAVNFTTNSALMAAVDYTGSQGLTALAPIYKYNVDYDNTTGDFNFSRFASGGYGDYNPAVLAAPVAAQLGGYLTQLNSYDEAFRNMDMYMLMTKSQRQAMKMRNKYAAAEDVLAYDSTKSSVENPSGWFRPFATFENVNLKNGPKVKNNLYGSFFGLESGLTELSRGWDGIWGVYAGYNGSHQHYDGIGIYQNGGTLGLTGMLYKDNFFTGLTANVGANAGSANTLYGNDDFAMLMTGVASKTGYNFELADGKFIIQPSYLMSYTMVDTFDYTNSAGIRINSDPLHAIQIEPGVKFIGNLKNGWQPYAGVSVVWNIMDKTEFKANDASLPNMSVKPFVKYGVGVRKSWGERLTGFFQAFITNGGRNGVGLQAGFKWALGKDDKQAKNKKQANTELPKIAKTNFQLNNIK